MPTIAFYPTDFGIIEIHATTKAVTYVKFVSSDTDLSNSQPNEISERAIAQIREYFAGNRTNFNIPLAPQGTDFQQQVWKTLCNIPYGETRTYKQIAQAIGNPKAVRAVGMANNKNPIAILIPCHRVIGSNGKLVGYAGGLDIKKRLLNLERRDKELQFLLM